MVFCFGNCSDLGWETIVLEWSRNNFEITRTIHLKSEGTDRTIFEPEYFFNLKVSISSIILEKQLKCQLEQIIGM